MSAADIALSIIKAEHRSLGTILHLLEELLEKVAAGRNAPEFALFSTALYYIDEFQERCHHPKEETYLFRALGAAAPDLGSLIEELQLQHVAGAHALAQLDRSLVRYQGGAADGLQVFKQHTEAYAREMEAHIRREDVLFEQARTVLEETEWERIAAAFDENDDPLFGRNRRAEFVHIYQRILTLAPRKLKSTIRSIDHG